MKKLIVLTLFAVIVFTACSENIYEIHSTHFAVTHDSTKEAAKIFDPGNYGEWKETNVIISINLKRDNIRINNECGDNFFILTSNEPKELIDEIGNKYTSFQTTCIDQNYDVCAIEWIIYELGLSKLYVNYSDIKYVYRGMMVL